MRKPKLFLSLCTVIAAGAFIFMVSCTKNKPIPAAKEDTGYATDQATTEKTFNDVQNIADQGATITSGSNLGYKTTATTAMGCATVHKSADSIVIDFGTTDCTCKDGRTRRGQVIVTYTGKYADSGSVHTITFNNFYQNDNKVTGTKTVTNMGHNSLGQPYFNVSINGEVTLAAGGTITAVWTRVRTWTDGYNTPTDFTDDTYTVSGSGTMTRANGSVVAVNIDAGSPLVVTWGCKWIESGTITYTLPGGLLRTLNYGTSVVCDDQATLTTPNGKVYNITLP